jgi:hypothetical protein
VGIGFRFWHGEDCSGTSVDTTGRDWGDRGCPITHDFLESQ